MYYSSIGLLAALVLIIINKDVFWKRSDDVKTVSHDAYRRFIFCVLAYYLTDIFWGILYQYELMFPVYLDTAVYFLAMALSIMYWTRFVVAYLNEHSWVEKALERVGYGLTVFQIGLIIINFFKPLLFHFDENNVYHAGPLRYLNLYLQIFMFASTSIHALFFVRDKNRDEHRRYLMIGLFGIAMVVMLSVQMLMPLQPMYSIGLMLGTCLLHSFVIEDEKDEYRRELYEALQREKQQQKEAEEARKRVNIDALTGVRSKYAYVEKENALNMLIKENSLRDTGCVVFDLNDLKIINDSQGHEAGDNYIISACKEICRHFKHSPVFRVGGDEFVAILENEDYENREELMKSFNALNEEKVLNGRSAIAAGYAVYESSDSEFQIVMNRADVRMYQQKNRLKDLRKESQ